MAHELAKTNGRVAMAYVGDTPWHGLGQKLSDGATVDTWIEEAGMSYSIMESQLKYGQGFAHTVPAKKALFRSDNGECLGVVGSAYNVVQPKDVLEFFRDLAADHGFTLETAGALFGGKKYWALAKTPFQFNMGKDAVKAHLMLATACDGSMSTVAKYVATRIVCNNTLSIAMREGTKGQVKTRHNAEFSGTSVKAELGILTESWKVMEEEIKGLSKLKLAEGEAQALLLRVMGDASKPIDKQPNPQNIANILELYNNKAIGSDMKSADHTAWGIVNCVSQWTDWQRGQDSSRRLEYAYWGGGDKLKSAIYKEAVALL